eukprot:1142640-Pelagomonas_calceolata.AAC.9
MGRERRSMLRAALLKKEKKKGIAYPGQEAVSTVIFEQGNATDTSCWHVLSPGFIGGTFCFS